MIFLAIAVGWLCRALAAVAKFVCRAPTRAGSFAVALKVHLRLRRAAERNAVPVAALAPGLLYARLRALPSLQGAANTSGKCLAAPSFS